MTFPVPISVTSAFSATQGLGNPTTIIAPAGIVNGDCMVATADVRAGTITDISMPGFSRLDFVDEGTWASALFFKIANGESGNYSLESDNTSSHGSVVISVYRGVDNLVPFAPVYSNALHHNYVGSSAILPNSITTENPDQMVVPLALVRTGGSLTITGMIPPAGYNLRVEDLGAATTITILSAMADLGKAVAGVEAPGAWTFNSSGTASDRISACYILALNPGALTPPVDPVPPVDPPYTVNNTFAGGFFGIDQGSILHYQAGVAASGSDISMVAAGSVSIDDIFNLLILRNDTDVNSVLIDDNIAPDTFAFLTGSTDFTGGGQTYAVVANITNGDIMFCESLVQAEADLVNVGKFKITIDWYVQIVTPDPDDYSPLYTQTISNLTGLTLGAFYSTALSTNGTLLLTPAAPPLPIAVLTNAVADAPAFNTITAHVDTDQGSGTLSYIATLNATPLTPAGVKAGASKAVNATGTQNVSIPGNIALTQYWVQFVQETEGGDSNVIVSNMVTTGNAPNSVAGFIA